MASSITASSTRNGETAAIIISDANLPNGIYWVADLPPRIGLQPTDVDADSITFSALTARQKAGDYLTLALCEETTTDDGATIGRYAAVNPTEPEAPADETTMVEAPATPVEALPRSRALYGPDAPSDLRKLDLDEGE